MNKELLIYLTITCIKIFIVFGMIQFMIISMIWFERKIMAHMQVRLGPMRVGPHGLLQPIADGIKLLFKEDIIPERANKFLFVLAPVMTLVPALITFAVIPFGDKIKIFGYSIDLVITDINVGFLYIFAVSSLGVYGVVMAGWASNNKYSLLGGIRSSAQMISYELTLGLSLIGVVMLTGSLSLVDIVNAQAKIWNIILQPIGFFIYVTSAFAEVNRTPFDLPEAESELVAGYHTEYSSMKFAMFFMAEYANMITVSAIAVTFFLGGWQGPFLPPVVWFMLKLSGCLFFFIWIRSTYPRLRYDQLMHFGWKFLLPLSLFNILITGLVMVIKG
ncbi:MAG: NADH-quinone oxidoreductase subunit NuoH [Candidatus Jettenia sp.]|nr:NADH-quinone oxidoreductase subunit NuoH [Candidatus Jettenia sp. AMX1]MBC6929490.1 NADH-quinone oxidoreductase subunit NuoH [Candidatus Jettenia sp.]NUN22328.1 NADH-quinone oxidoreductase subunit NuoH [Candidatus Jettenia caeni]KAA0249386.1 MAG: NADH-quinone oxidoreductase subunit NuoH [Candidatus Jettenia sp. AMX1]MCE7880944.1 NADH-quinone oxidoreductase subunit NuoH [Candidatus Jettenia sp. AMX1]MCQ3927681.1 NADH-quinone oxidoreductase subunit NuoH [Candidatus Jettenia sp.]